MEDLDALTDNLLSGSFSIVRQSNNMPTGTDYTVSMLHSKQVRERDALVAKLTELRRDVLAYMCNTHAAENGLCPLENSSEGALTAAKSAAALADVALAEWFSYGGTKPMTIHLKRKRAEDVPAVESKRRKLSRAPIPKVQVAWQDPNCNYRPAFVPRIPLKYNSNRPLQDSLIAAMKNPVAVPPHIVFANPYEKEIAELPIPTALFDDTLVPIIPLEEVPLRFVDTVEALQEMLNELKREVVVAVDLEHHSKHSYRGITCLIQISSPSVDYVVDPFPIWHSVSELNQVFTDPGIMKLFFGCVNSDVLWLQRDFSVYVVNLFDVQEGIRMLQTPGGYSFGNAVGFYLSQTIGKEHQRSDWRQRPLADDMITYARLDTRLLLPLFAHVRRQLLYRGSTELGIVGSLGRNSIATVYDKCKTISCAVYQDRRLNEAEKALQVMHKEGVLEGPGPAILRELFVIREQLAQEMDESVGMLISEPTLHRIAREKPQSHRELAALLFPPNDFLRARPKEILQAVACPGKVVRRPAPEHVPQLPVVRESSRPEALVLGAVSADFREVDSYPVDPSPPRPHLPEVMVISMSVPSFLNEHLQKVKHLQQQLVAYRAKTDALSRQVESLEETKIRQATELGTWKEALYDWKSIAEARTAELAGDSADRIAFLEEALAKAKQRPSAEQLAHWRGQAELEKNSSRSLAAQLEEALAEEHKTRTLLEPLTNYSGSLSSSVEALIVLHREEICRVTTELAESQETITGLQLDMARLEGRYEDLENVVADNTEELTMQQNRIEALDEEALQLRIKSASENAGHQETIERLTMALEQREREMPIDTQGQVAQMKHRIEELGEEVTSHQLREESLNEARADLELHVASLQDELVRVRESVAESQSDVPPERAAQAVIDHLTEQLRVLETRKEEETALLRLTIEDLQEQLNEESSSSDMEPPTEVRQRIVVPPFRLATAYDPPVRLASILDRWAANPLLAQMLNTTVN